MSDTLFGGPSPALFSVQTLAGESGGSEIKIKSFKMVRRDTYFLATDIIFQNQLQSIQIMFYVYLSGNH